MNYFWNFPFNMLGPQLTEISESGVRDKEALAITWNIIMMGRLSWNFIRTIFTRSPRDHPGLGLRVPAGRFPSSFIPLLTEITETDTKLGTGDMDEHHHPLETRSSRGETTEERLWEARQSSLGATGEKPHSSFVLRETVRNDAADNRDRRAEGGRRGQTDHGGETPGRRLSKKNFCIILIK